MVDYIKTQYGLDDSRVLKAMAQIPREEFVPNNLRDLAYSDQALNIGFGQTISQPYTVAFMTHLLNLKGGERVLEIGTGSGYQAAVLSKLAKKVCTIEIIPHLANSAAERFKKLGIKNVEVRTGRGQEGWDKKTKFDAIIVTAAIEGEIPPALISSLKNGGVIVAPIGKDSQKMVRITKKGGKLEKEEFGTFQFVPFIK